MMLSILRLGLPTMIADIRSESLTVETEWECGTLLVELGNELKAHADSRLGDTRGVRI